MSNPQDEEEERLMEMLTDAAGRPVGACLGRVEPLRHPQSQRFHELLKAAGDMHDRKQSDYGRGDAPFANIEASEEWGVPAWVGSMIRLNDKVRRLQKPAQGGTLANEGILDSLMDIAVYALIAYVMVEEEALDNNPGVV